MKVGVVASTKAPLCESVIITIVGFISPADVVYVRGTYTNVPIQSGMVTFTPGWVGLTEIEKAVQAIRPDTIPIQLVHAGKRSGFIRDRNFVRSAKDGVLAFFSEDRVMDGGTGHIVDVCIEESVPIEAYVVHNDGSLWHFAGS